MKNLIPKSNISQRLQLKLSLLLILSTVFWSGLSWPDVSRASTPAAVCAKTLVTSDKLEARYEIISELHSFQPGELISALESSGRLLFKGDHSYIPGHEFLASNEFDWPLTPFDHTEGDVMIAFATNSAWEIAADKNVKDLIIGDWSPNPLIAHAYIWAPIWKLANSPTELILLMGGIKPTPKLLTMDVLSAITYANEQFQNPTQERAQAVIDFLTYLAETPLISDLELKVLTSYYVAGLGLYASSSAVGPFRKMHPRSALGILDLMDLRYIPGSLYESNPKLKGTDEVYRSQSVLHNPEMFKRIKNLFVTDSVKYALTSVNDPAFYQRVRQQFPAKDTRFSLSLSNIFDCGGYNCLTFPHFQALLREAHRTLGASAASPLVVFRTANDRPPHGFYRYDIRHVEDIPGKDESDSVALSGKPSQFEDELLEQFLKLVGGQ